MSSAATTHHGNVSDHIHHLIQSINATAKQIDSWISESHDVAQTDSVNELQRIFDKFEHEDKHKYAHTLGEWLKVLEAENVAAAAAASEDGNVDKEAARYEYGVVRVAYYDAFPDPTHENSFPEPTDAEDA